MKCPNCGMNYETKECPNCAAEKVLYSSSPNASGGKIPNFRTEAEYDAYMAKEEERKLKKGVDRWMMAFWLFFSFGIMAFILELIISLGSDYSISFAPSALFGGAVSCLFFWYLSDIRCQLILLNKKRK